MVFQHFYICCSSFTLSELDALRLQTQTAQTESASAASQTAAMMSLNLKLQSSAAKNQARNVELELAKLEARENKELLRIIQVSHSYPNQRCLEVLIAIPAVSSATICGERQRRNKLLSVLPPPGIQD